MISCITLHVRDVDVYGIVTLGLQDAAVKTLKCISFGFLNFNAKRMVLMSDPCH